MNKPTNFDNEIIQPKNLNFLADSTDTAIKDIFTTMFGNSPGIVSGLDVTATVGDGSFNVSAGYGYTGDGEKVQVYTGTSFGIAFTGTRSIFLTYTTIDYNPDPSVNPTKYVNTNIDPITGDAIPTESYIFPVITLTSGSDYINLGQVTADSSQQFVSFTGTGRTSLYLGGFLNLNESAIDGLIVQSGTLDSTKFTNPLTGDIYLDGNVSILNSSTGNFLGSSSNPFSGIYTAELTVHEIHGSSPVIVDGGITLTAGDAINIQSGPLSIDASGNGATFGGSITTSSIKGVTDANLNISAFGTGTAIIQANGGASKIIVGTTNIISGSTTMVSDLSLQTGISILGLGSNYVGTNSNPINNIVATTTTTTTLSATTANATTVNATTINATQIGSAGTPIPTLYVDNLVSSLAAGSMNMIAYLRSGNGYSSFTVPSNVYTIKVKMWGGGGGGGGGQGNFGEAAANGSAGGNSSVGGASTSIYARGGSGGGANGTAASSKAAEIYSQNGIVGFRMGSNAGAPAGYGMISYPGGGGSSGYNEQYDPGSDSMIPTYYFSGGPGAQGEYSEFIVPTSPGALLDVYVGEGGAGGSPGSGGIAGSAGGPGMVVIQWG